MRARLTAAIAMGKTSAFLSRATGVGGGTTFPGIVALRIDSQIVQKIASALPYGAILITGTNGKTTTARLLASILRHAGLSPVHNRAGANLVSGVASALVERAGLGGQPRADVGLFEVDEATLPVAVERTRPRAVIITNLFRDQLDRYGEVDYVAGLWRKALEGLPTGSVLVLNADDPRVADLGRGVVPQVIYYGLEDERLSVAGPQHTADARYCRECGAAYQYEACYYGHLGKYRCPGCGATRPRPQVYATGLNLLGIAGTELHLSSPWEELPLAIKLPGLYNVYNILAAATCALALGFAPSVVKEGVEGFAAAFGRLERVQVDGKQLFLALVKNPVGFNEVLRTLLANGTPLKLLILINDNFADGTDISWLWDVDFERLRGRVGLVVVSGTRAEDMALRLKYAGLDTSLLRIEKEPGRALESGLAATARGETLYVLPTYTAMLGIRQMMRKKGYVGAFWED